MKRILIFLLCLYCSVVVRAQSVTDIQNDLDQYIQNHINLPLPEMAKHEFEIVYSQSDEEHGYKPSYTEALADYAQHYWSSQFWIVYPELRADALRLQKNNQTASKQSLVPGSDLCLHGGFEDNTNLFEVEYTTFNSNSNNCATVPNLSGWIIPMSNIERHMIKVSAGPDGNVTGLVRTHSGDSALRINARINSNNGICGSFGKQVDRARATFDVDAQTTNLSFWYAIVMENPSEHNSSNGQKPFVTIQAVDANSGVVYQSLCFDPSQNNMLIDNAVCNAPDSMNWVPWTCAHFDLSAAVGETVYFDVIVADCGLGGHFAYAYLDDICLGCGDPGDIGNVVIDQQSDCCFGNGYDYTGSYNLPTIPGYSVNSLTIQFSQNGNVINTVTPTWNTNTQTFSGNIPASWFQPNQCYDMVSTIMFVGTNLDTIISVSEITPGINNDLCVPSDTSCAEFTIDFSCTGNPCFASSVYLYVHNENNQVIYSNGNPYVINWTPLPSGTSYSNQSSIVVNDITQTWVAQIVNTQTGCTYTDTFSYVCCDTFSVEIYHTCPPSEDPCNMPANTAHTLSVLISGQVVSTNFPYTINWYDINGNFLTSGNAIVGPIVNIPYVVEIIDSSGCVHRDTFMYVCCKALGTSDFTVSGSPNSCTRTFTAQIPPNFTYNHITWNWGDGNPSQTVNTLSTNHTFANSGSYWVEMNVMVYSIADHNDSCKIRRRKKVNVSCLIALPGKKDALENEDPFQLEVYPNPFNNELQINFDVLTTDKPIEVSVYNNLMEKIETIREASLPESENVSISWQPKRRLSPGVYYVVLKQDGERRIKQVVHIE